MKLLRLKNGRMRCVIMNGGRRGRSTGVPSDPLVVTGGCHFGYFSQASLQQYSEAGADLQSDQAEKNGAKKMQESLKSKMFSLLTLYRREPN